MPTEKTMSEQLIFSTEQYCKATEAFKVVWLFTKYLTYKLRLKSPPDDSTPHPTKTNSHHPINTEHRYPPTENFTSPIRYSTSVRTPNKLSSRFPRPAGSLAACTRRWSRFRGSPRAKNSRGLARGVVPGRFSSPYHQARRRDAVARVIAALFALVRRGLPPVWARLRRGGGPGRLLAWLLARLLDADLGKGCVSLGNALSSSSLVLCEGREGGGGMSSLKKWGVYVWPSFEAGFSSAGDLIYISIVEMNGCLEFSILRRVRILTKLGLDAKFSIPFRRVAECPSYFYEFMRSFENGFRVGERFFVTC